MAVSTVAADTAVADTMAANTAVVDTEAGDIAVADSAVAGIVVVDIVVIATEGTVAGTAAHSKAGTEGVPGIFFFGGG